MIVAGTALRIEGDDVDTDVLYPGPFLSIEEPERMKDHLFEGLDPGLRDQLGPGTILLVGRNFGSGSSREHVPRAMRASGITCLVGQSFARIFYRNCINLGLLAIVSAGAAEAGRTGSQVRIDTDAGTVEVDGASYETAALPAFLLATVEAGGLVEAARRRA